MPLSSVASSNIALRATVGVGVGIGSAGTGTSVQAPTAIAAASSQVGRTSLRRTAPGNIKVGLR